MSFKKFVCGPLENNVYLLICDHTKMCALIDPAQGAAKKIIPYIKEHQLQLEYILLTHSHWDHVMDVSKIQQHFLVKVALHTLDKENLESPGSDGLPVYHNIPPVQADLLLEDQEKIDLGELIISVIHTPGHTPGGLCFYIEKEKLLFSGDTFFKGTCGAIHFPGASPSCMWDSLKKLSTLPSDTHVLPGHGPETTISKESWLSDAEKIFS